MKTLLPPREFTTASLEYQQVLRRKGRMAARIISPFAHWGIVPSAGLKRDPSRDDEGSDLFTDKQVQFFLSARENELYRTFKALQRLLIPNIREELLRHGSQATVMFGVHLNQGSKGTHSSDISSIKAAISKWYPTWRPPYNANMKHEMGFRHPDCGKWLCPADLDWKDDGIRQQLRDGRIVPGPADYNRGLYDGHDPDPNDLVSGFLRDDEIVRAYNHIFILPTTALAENGAGDKSTGKGNAWAMRPNTTCLRQPSNQYIMLCTLYNTFQAAGNNGLFSYRKYFNFLQHSVRLWPEADQKSLLTWWNEKVFSHRSEAQPAKRADGSLSIAERMAAQATTAKAAISRLENV
ncbi:hypothetical protein B0H14DRAFT_2590138 [Mycena olivaceomarginata]|nr:hypothetical protein B0H14DRAFT_2590138 [Mycena olivaceomarginata]